MIIQYEDKYEKCWDEFVLNDSMNGNFLQTRNFLNYHKKNLFVDGSLMFFKGETLAAVMPANIIEDGKVLISHEGSTFGGIIVGETFCSTTNYKWIFEELSDYIKEQRYERVEIRTSSRLYKRLDKSNELLDYYYQLHGFTNKREVGFFVDLSQIDDNYEKNFDSLKRRKLKKAAKFDLSFREITDEKGIEEFYYVLADNMKKFDTVPVHTCEEMKEFKFKRLCDNVSFFGVYLDNVMVAGSMVFDFCNKKVFHTQYLASRHDYLECCPNEYLYTNLIRTAKEMGYRYLSYGTSTLNHGDVYNESLGLYKEGFNTDTYLNTTYIYRGDVE